MVDRGRSRLFVLIRLFDLFTGKCLNGRIEKRTVSSCQKPLGMREWPGFQTLIRALERQLTKGGLTIVIHEVRYYIASIIATEK